jgi:hypothetical protein
MDAVLRQQLAHGCEAQVFARLRSPVWLEDAGAACSPAPHLIALRFVCLWHPRPATVLVEPELGLVYGDNPWPELAETLSHLTVPPGSAPAAIVGAVLRELRAQALSLWPADWRSVAPADLVPDLARDVVDGMMALSLRAGVHPPLVLTSDARWLMPVVSGVCAMAALLSNACNSTRGPTVCRPVPHCWYLHGTRELGGAWVRGGGHGAPIRAGAAVSGSPLDAAGEDGLSWDHRRMLAAVRGLPSLDAWSNDWLVDSTVGQLVPRLCALSPEAAMLLHWLIVLAPTKLVLLLPSAAPAARLTPDLWFHTARQAAGATSREFAVVRGPACAALYAAAAAVPSDSCPDWTRGLQSQGGLAIATDVRAVAQHGWILGPATAPGDRRLAEMWCHGTSSENAFAMLHLGLRSFSGTRLERNGAIYGDGIYTVNSVQTALGFARGSGVAWNGDTPRQLPGGAGVASEVASDAPCTLQAS